MTMNAKIPLLVILGPTASGKTALSLKLARALNGEIVSVDSRQIYREIDIGSDKIPLEKDGNGMMCHDGIPHHMIDFVSPDQVYTMSDFKRDAEKLIGEIHARGKLPMLVGGTGLYIRAIAQNYEIPDAPPNPELRQKYEKILEEHGVEKGREMLHAILQERDPDAAKSIHKNNTHYVIRALEIIDGLEKGGKVAKKESRRGESPYDVYMLGIDWPRAKLWERIDKRVDDQVKRGLIEESKVLLEKYNIDLPSISSLGAKEFAPYFAGDASLEQVLARLKSATRKYAKRQQTWFRKEPDVHWIDGEELEKEMSRQPEILIERLVRDILTACPSLEKNGS